LAVLPPEPPHIDNFKCAAALYKIGVNYEKHDRKNESGSLDSDFSEPCLHSFETNADTHTDCNAYAITFAGTFADYNTDSAGIRSHIRYCGTARCGIFSDGGAEIIVPPFRCGTYPGIRTSGQAGRASRLEIEVRRRI